MQDRLTHWTRLLAIFTGLLFLITVIIAGLSYSQLRDSQRTFAISNRPFVYIQAVQPVAAFDKADKTRKIASFFIPLINNGNTPTKSLILYVRCAPSVDALPEPWFLLYREKIEQIPVLIGPKAVVMVHCTFSADELIKMRDGKLHGYIMGEVKYHDQLDPTIEHRTQFSLELIDVNIDDAQTVLAGVFPTSHGAHNCADDDCPK